MSGWTRRDLVKGSLAVGASVLTGQRTATAEEPQPLAPSTETLALLDDASSTTLRERLRMDLGWRFALGNACDPRKDFGFGKLSREGVFAKAGHVNGPAAPDFDDSTWRPVQVPHDWAVELPFINDPGLPDHGGKPIGREYPETSIGWYRLQFVLPAQDVASRIAIEFDGIFRNATVFLNGHYLAQNLSGYVPLHVDVTDYVSCSTQDSIDRVAKSRARAEASLAKVDRSNKSAVARAEAALARAHAAVPGQNTLVVRVDATLDEGWFYEGAGIYRHAWLIKTAPVHIAPWGQFVRTELTAIQSQPGGSGTAKAQVLLSTEATNDSASPASISAVTQIFDSAARLVASAQSPTASIAPGETLTLDAATSLAGTALWCPDTPTLYRAVTTLLQNNKPIDRLVTSFGARKIVFDPNRGMLLNDQHVKLLGTCNHQDHAGVGAAIPDALQAYRVKLLREMGSNAIRTSHNAPTPELLDACDRLGMMVMDEARTMASTPEGLDELTRQIKRDRNHPSVVIWSLGNEEPEQGTERGRNIVGTMQALQRRLDPTRVATVAMNGSWGQGVSNVIAVQGFNYGVGNIAKYREGHPNQPLVGTETASTTTTRGIYADDKPAGYVNAYGTHNPGWAETPEGWWAFYDEHAYLSGGFIWTGFDYRGEPTPYGWPCISSHFGLMDTCGFPKDVYFYYSAWWGKAPSLHILPHWNNPPADADGKVAVWAYSNQQSVELFLNGQSLGSKPVPKNGHVEWKVKYAPGFIEARASSGGKVTLTERRATTGPAASLLATVDRSQLTADGRDVAIVNVAVVDAKGSVVPEARNKVSFHLTGGGEIIGVGNGDPSCHEPDKATERSAFGGLLQTIVQAPRSAATLQLTATSPGLQPATLTITVAPA
jgi:beta-galactosidase